MTVFNVSYRFSALDRFSQTFGSLNRNFKGIASTAQKSSKRISRSFGNIDGVMKKLDKRSQKLKSNFVGATASLAAFALPTKMAMDFGKSLAELQTVAAPAGIELGALTAAARSMAVEFGQSPTSQSAAFYQTVSAGANSSADAIARMRQANILAVGGMTNIEIAVRGLSSVMNAYAVPAEQAGSVADVFFVAVKDGVTKVDELAASMGNVSGIANETGVSMDALFSSVAAITKVGISTSMAVTQVRGVLKTLLKPSDDARKTAKALGLNFSIAAIKAKGFGGFLKDLSEKVGGNQEALALLFPDVEGMQGAMNLTGGAAEFFADTMKNMANKAGAAKAAFKIIADTPWFKTQQAMQGIAVAAVDFGEKLLPGVVAIAGPIKAFASGVSKLIDKFPVLTKVIGTAIGGFLALRLASIVIGFVFLDTVKALASVIAWGGKYALATRIQVYALDALTIAQTLFNTVMAANPIYLAIAAIAGLIAVGVLLWKNWDWITEKLSGAWEAFGDMFPRLAASIEMHLAVIKHAFAAMIDPIIWGINQLIAALNSVGGMNIKPIKLVGGDTSLAKEIAAIQHKMETKLYDASVMAGGGVGAFNQTQLDYMNATTPGSAIAAANGQTAAAAAVGSAAPVQAELNGTININAPEGVVKSVNAKTPGGNMSFNLGKNNPSR